MSAPVAHAALSEAKEHLDAGLVHHAAGNHDGTKRRMELARACVQRAIEASPEYTDPTKAAGAQVSNGQSPRSLTVDEIRARDQRRGCDASYRRRMEGR
jgi:hypothetical protein